MLKKKVKTLENFVIRIKRVKPFWAKMSIHSSLRVLSFLTLTEKAIFGSVCSYFRGYFKEMYFGYKSFHNVSLSKFSMSELIKIKDTKIDENIRKIFKGKNFAKFVETTEISYKLVKVKMHQKVVSLSITPKVSDKFNMRQTVTKIMDSDIVPTLNDAGGYLNHLILFGSAMLTNTTFRTIAQLGKLTKLSLGQCKYPLLSYDLLESWITRTLSLLSRGTPFSPISMYSHVFSWMGRPSTV